MVVPEICVHQEDYSGHERLNVLLVVQSCDLGLQSTVCKSYISKLFKIALNYFELINSFKIYLYKYMF